MPGANNDLSFDEYVEARRTILLRSARRLLADPWEAEDLLQTALLATYRRWNSIEQKSHADVYVHRAMYNLRTEGWQRRKLTEVPTEHLPDMGFEEDKDLETTRRMLLDALATLAPQQQRVVLLRYFDEYSTQETARILGITPGTVKSSLHRACRLLCAELKRHD
ncbi:SigE family RNA polymerase sigma factor [Streptomyces sp. SAS_270]|uniref:SigE family RNA polymerase sigma factor n=1 Tax=Streptomyces sp. SAS_270 TaxID=3412748 RepID=UPI00403C87B7